MAGSARVAQARVALRMLLGLTDRGKWLAPGVLGCAYPRTDRALAALSAKGVRLLVNLHGRPHEKARLERHGLREVHLPVKDFAAPSPEQTERAMRTILEAGKQDACNERSSSQTLCALFMFFVPPEA